MTATTHTVGEIDTFITMLRAACDDRDMNAKLEHLLSMPDERRHVVVRKWVDDLVSARAPGDFTQAVACLADDRVAQKAYEVIYQCERKLVDERGNPWVAAALVASSAVIVIALLYAVVGVRI